MAINAISAKNAKKTLQDGNGLMLRVDKKGRKYWECRYSQNGARPTYRLGPWSEEHGPKWARQKHRDDVLDKLEQGIDPKAKSLAPAIPQGDSSFPNFREVGQEWFDAQSPGWSRKVVSATQGRLDKYMFLAFGHLPINVITTGMVKKFLKQFEGKDRESARLETRDKVHQQLKQIFGSAVVDEIIPYNPAEFSRKLAGLQLRKAGSELESQTYKMLAEEPEDAWELLPQFWADLSNDSVNKIVEIMIKVTVLTLSRPNEVRGGKWAEIDWNKKIWSVPASRMKRRKAHVIPLSNQVIALLRELQKYTGDYGHMFPKFASKWGSEFDDSSSLSDATARIAVRRLGYVADIHGFRHMASSFLHAASIGEGEDERPRFQSVVIEFALSHADKNKIREVYNKHEYRTPRARMLQWYADQICPAPQIELVEKSA